MKTREQVKMNYFVLFAVLAVSLCSSGSSDEANCVLMNGFEAIEHQ